MEFYYVSYFSASKISNDMDLDIKTYLNVQYKTLVSTVELERYIKKVEADLENFANRHKKCSPAKLTVENQPPTSIVLHISSESNKHGFLQLTKTKDYQVKDLFKPTFEQILQLKKEYEDEIYRKPKLVDSGAFYRKDDRRILQTAVMLAECDIPYTVQKYKDYLRKKSIPLSYLEKINNYLNEHYNQK